MKKTFLVLVLVCLGSVVYGQSAVIRELSGTVELKRAGSDDFVTANIGDQVAQDTVISTGFRSSALVELGSSLITVRALTRLSLTEIQSSAASETVNLNLQAGRIRVDVNPPAGTRASLAVTGPTATASVRGTSFEIDTRNVFVDHGSVSFRGNQSRTSEFVVYGGESSSIDSSGSARDPTTVARQAIHPARPGANVPTSASRSSSRGSGDVSFGVSWGGQDP